MDVMKRASGRVRAHPRRAKAIGLGRERSTLDPRWIREQVTHQYWSMINSRVCPFCSGPIKTTEKRGCCTHAMPCGHKLWFDSGPILSVYGIPYEVDPEQQP